MANTIERSIRMNVKLQHQTSHNSYRAQWLFVDFFVVGATRAMAFQCTRCNRRLRMEVVIGKRVIAVDSLQIQRSFNPRTAIDCVFCTGRVDCQTFRMLPLMPKGTIRIPDEGGRRRRRAYVCGTATCSSLRRSDRPKMPYLRIESKYSHETQF